MACGLRLSCRDLVKIKNKVVNVSKRYSNTISNKAVEKHRHSLLCNATKEEQQFEEQTSGSRDYKFIYPEFLPNPDLVRRDKLTERLERRDMLARRAVITIPEFYVGSVLAVSVADCYASGKTNRFLGVCIQRDGNGLRANFTLRNIIDGQGVEIKYDLYSPLLHKIDVLKLEKRLDDELLYLRDAPPEYSTFSFDFEAVSLPSSVPVPINHMKVKLGPRPWSERWERRNLKGIEDLHLPQRFYDRALHPQISQPSKKHDLMLKYRENINDVETTEIMSEVYSQMKLANINKKVK